MFFSSFIFLFIFIFFLRFLCLSLFLFSILYQYIYFNSISSFVCSITYTQGGRQNWIRNALPFFDPFINSSSLSPLLISSLSQSLSPSLSASLSIQRAEVVEVMEKAQRLFLKELLDDRDRGNIT